MAKPPFTGVQPFRYDGREVVVCEPHRAHGWQPVLHGKLLLANGHVLRYVRKADALDALTCATLRRAPRKRAYRLGKPMEKRA